MIRDGMTWEESIGKEKEYRKLALDFISKANALKRERIAISAAGQLAQAEFVKKRGTELHTFQPRGPHEDDKCDWCGRRADEPIHSGTVRKREALDG